MSSVRKRILPSGAIRWLVSYRDGSGRRRFKQFPTRKAAENWSARTHIEVLDGTHVAEADSLTLARVAEAWRSHIRSEVMANRMERSTGEYYEGLLDNHVLDPEVGVGMVKMNRLNLPTTNLFRDRLLESRSGGVTRRSISVLKLIIDYGIGRGWATINHAKDIRIRRSSRLKPKTNVPSAEDVRAVMENCQNPFRTIFIIAAFCGLRASEVYGLEWCDIDFDAAELGVRQRVDPYGRIGEPKSAAGERIVPMGRFTLNALRQWRLQCGDASGLVFKNRAGKPLDHHNVHPRWFKPAFTIKDECGNIIREIPRFRFHDLRHFAISLWISQDFSPKQVMTFAGHSSITITFDRYGHLFPEPESLASVMSEAELRVVG